jgi:hypothetical protein
MLKALGPLLVALHDLSDRLAMLAEVETPKPRRHRKSRSPEARASTQRGEGYLGARPVHLRRVMAEHPHGRAVALDVLHCTPSVLDAVTSGRIRLLPCQWQILLAALEA